MISVFLDNIIFSLQKAGGASVVWQEHIGRLLCDNTITSTYLEYDNACENVFRKLLTIPQSLLKVRGTKGLFLKRYLDLNNQDYKSPYVFHSSHYRIDHSPKAINVTTVHDFTYEYFIPGIRKWIHSSQKWHAIKKSDAIICISESTKNDLLHFLPDINEAKIHVIHNGVNCTYRVLSPEDYKLDLPFADKEYILYVGSRLTSYKNFKSVVKVCSVLKIPLIMIGRWKLS